jgi:hypothetical protein
MTRIIVTPYGELFDMDPPYLSAEYMDKDAGILRAHYRRLEREKWFADHPEFDHAESRTREKWIAEKMKVVEQARRAKSRARPG